jgi:hypothetical protein
MEQLQMRAKKQEKTAAPSTILHCILYIIRKNITVATAVFRNFGPKFHQKAPTQKVSLPANAILRKPTTSPPKYQGCRT